MNISEKHNELMQNGKVRLYENEGFNLSELLKSFEIMFDPELFAVTIHGSNEGKYIQVVNLQN